ncbi:PepSY domain-containing protein [Sporosarcina sp. ACRSL]|uniref:PepSY domain-containing protein n=1 Tax=Sporosarcina sp. ACRSL TaxID=2918215 RepID=UPI001EF5381B|nr:PepSY domain-containing protein [Sporosarcina sp. ACRSL]MCG7343674.1 PepSY domain-containing protein [Sporosarcina sp. ACRSL]
MDILKIPWFIAIVLTVIIVIAGQLYTSGKLTKAEAMPKEEIRTQLETIYDGEVKDLVLDGSVYKAIVTKIGAEYEVEVDAATGNVLSLFQTKETSDIVMDSGESTEETMPSAEKSAGQKSENSMTEKADEKAADKTPSNVPEKPKSDVNKTTTKPKPSNQPAKQEKKRVLISEQEAMKIGLAQLPAGTVGEVDDVDFVNSADGGYYLVEIDIDTEDDMDEVTYQIHAISGKVLTVSWDDE